MDKKMIESGPKSVVQKAYQNYKYRSDRNLLSLTGPSKIAYLKMLLGKS